MAETPLLKDTDDRQEEEEDEDEENQNHFQPVGSSTPGPQGEEISMKTMHHEESGLPDTSYAEETSFGGTLSHDEIARRLAAVRNKDTYLLATKNVGKYEQLLSDEEKEKEKQRVKDYIKKEYPEVDFDKLGKIRFATNLKRYKAMDVVVVGPEGGETKILLDNGSGFRSEFLKANFVKKALGLKVKDINNENLRKMMKEKDEIEKQLKEKQKELKQIESMANENEKLKNEMEEIRNRTRQFEEQITALEDTHGPLNKEEIEKLKQQKNNLQKEHQEKAKQLDQIRKAAKNAPKLKDVQKLTQENVRLNETIGKLQEKINTEDLNEKKQLTAENEQQIAELKRQKEEYRLVIDDEETSPSDKATAEDRIAEIDGGIAQREEENARLKTEVEERERAMPLLERLKEFFKKYGLTLASIVTAAIATIGAVISGITNSALKAMGNGLKKLGNGLKEIGKKIASILPGLIGSIVSFLFKAAGQAIGFLAEHTWLLILAVVAFLVEGQIKKQR